MSSSFLDPNSSSEFTIDPQEPPPGRDAESLNRPKNVLVYSSEERPSSPTKTYRRPESTTNGWNVRSALLVICIPAFLLTIYSYDPTHSRLASPETFSRVCFPASTCLLRLYLPTILLDPPAIIYVISVLGFGAVVLELHGIRRADKFQDRILALGFTCGFLLSGFLAFKGEGVAAFKDIMPAIIMASLVASAMVHTFLEKWGNG